MKIEIGGYYRDRLGGIWIVTGTSLERDVPHPYLSERVGGGLEYFFSSSGEAEPQNAMDTRSERPFDLIEKVGV